MHITAAVARIIVGIFCLTPHPLKATGPGALRGTLTQTPIPSAFMGLTTGDFVHLRPTLQFGTTRSWDSGGGSSPLDWADLNPSRGRYDLSPIDRFIAFTRLHHADAIYTFGRTPRWASSRPNDHACKYEPGTCSPPDDLGYCDAFVSAVVAHSSGQIKYWELWNEPQDPSFFSGDIPTMVRMARRARDIIKRIDPSATLVGPAVTGPDGPAWLARFLAEGGAASIDVLAFHGYRSARAEDIVNVIDQYKTVASNAHIATMPMWDTEGSWAGSGNTGTPSIEEQVAFIPKYYVLQASAGLSRVVWYAYDGGAIWGGLEIANRETSAATSFAMTYRWLVGATLVAPCREDEVGTWTCALARPNGYLGEIVWNSDRAAHMTAPPQYSVYTFVTGETHALRRGVSLTVGTTPLILETRSWR
jgi:hypothetical protein